MANLIIATLCWTSSQCLNVKQGNTTLFVHPKEIYTLDIFHCIADEEYNSVQIESGSGRINIDDYRQRDEKGVFYESNKSNYIYGYKTIKEFFYLFEKNF